MAFKPKKTSVFRKQSENGFCGDDIFDMRRHGQNLKIQGGDH